jgi:general secretion pathway protein E
MSADQVTTNAAAAGPSSGSPASDELRTALKAARMQHRAGAGAVLDILLRGVSDRAALLTDLSSRAGVSVLLDQVDASPDFERWTHAQAKQFRCVVVRTNAGESLVAAEDPWDESILQRVARVVPGLTPAVVPRASIDAWLGNASVALGTPSPKLPAPLNNAAPVASSGDGPIVAFVDQAMKAALRM